MTIVARLRHRSSVDVTLTQGSIRAYVTFSAVELTHPIVGAEAARLSRAEP